MQSAKTTKAGNAHGRSASRRSLAALCVLAALSGGCAGTQQQLSNIWNMDPDKRHEMLSRKFADVVDASDKMFGEARVEDRQEIVRAKVGVKAEVREGQDTDWSVPANFRIPLPALSRKANIFIDATASPDSSNLSDPSAAVDEKDGSISATALRRISDTVDLGATLGVHGGPDIGPEIFARYEKKWEPWMLFGEQRGYWRTDNGWGGKTVLNLDYRLPGKESFISWANKADYYEELHDVDLKSGLLYRWMLPQTMGIAADQGPQRLGLSAETGIEYNPYDGDPEEDNDTNPENDDDQAYVRLRMIGKVWRPWIEWEGMPGFYYYWEHDSPEAWGIDLRVSLIYESFLRGPGE
jgi:hypothetical protein